MSIYKQITREVYLDLGLVKSSSSIADILLILKVHINLLSDSR